VVIRSNVHDSALNAVFMNRVNMKGIFLHQLALRTPGSIPSSAFNRN
jgi:hypothetical protein